MSWINIILYTFGLYQFRKLTAELKKKNRILNFKKRNTQIEDKGKADNTLKVISVMSLDKNASEKNII